MELKFTVKDIRNHLSELGYKSVPEDKLTTFVSDLQRLIKYEERRKHLEKKLTNLDGKRTPEGRKKRERRRSHRRTVSDAEEPDESSIDEGQANHRNSKLDAMDGRSNKSTSHSARLVAGIDKTTTQSIHTTTTTVEDRSTAATTTTSSTVVTSALHQTEQSSLYVDIVIPRARSSDRGLPKQNLLSATLLDKKSLASNTGVIRCRTTGGGQPARRGRTDPVRLHTEYRKTWEKLNLPGETSHNKLRWAVRGWMMGEEPC